MRNSKVLEFPLFIVFSAANIFHICKDFFALSQTLVFTSQTTIAGAHFEFMLVIARYEKRLSKGEAHIARGLKHY
jgi:hypothetical protein